MTSLEILLPYGAWLIGLRPTPQVQLSPAELRVVAHVWPPYSHRTVTSMLQCLTSFSRDAKHSAKSVPRLDVTGAGSCLRNNMARDWMTTIDNDVTTILQSSVLCRTMSQLFAQDIPGRCLSQEVRRGYMIWMKHFIFSWVRPDYDVSRTQISLGRAFCMSYQTCK